MTLKKYDFVELDYTGKLTDGTVFDTSIETVAKETGITREGATFEPVKICLGANHMLPKLEESLIGKDIGKHAVDLKVEDAFGKKSAKLLQLVPKKVFTKENINPFPGLEVNIDGRHGTIRTVSGGRIIVDFNHPLSGKDLHYDLDVKKKIEDVNEQLKIVFANDLQTPDLGYELKENKVELHENVPQELLEPIKKRIMELIPSIKDVIIKTGKKED